MPMRPLRLPQDFRPIGEMIPLTFQYPDHPEWGFREDERNEIARTIRTLRRLWPLLRFLGLFSSSLRDVYRGFVWEEDDRVVAVVLLSRDGTTAGWEIAVVGVLPEYRRRGLARTLLVRSIDYLRERKAEKATLGVIDRNVPAYSLYTSLGFDHYSGTMEYELTPSPSDAPAAQPLPAGYVTEPFKPAQGWRLRYELDRRIAPAELVVYEPVELARYRPPPLLRLLLPIVRWMQRSDRTAMVIREIRSGHLVALATTSIPRKRNGVQSMRLRLDPAHGELADYLVAGQLRHFTAKGAEQRVELMLPRWMSVLASSAERHGFTKRLEYHHLGLTL